jgi:hypothetical protein
MANYIATYFYQDDADLGASYGNIFLPLVERNLIYWKTVFTFFYSVRVFHKEEDVNLVLFTNVHTFPFMDEIEDLGVKIYNNLELTHRGDKKWATVKFFFDVVNFINNSEIFYKNDNFVLLDTDVVMQKNANDLFNKINKINTPQCYTINSSVKLDTDFHGMSVQRMNEVGSSILHRPINIKKLLGGEYFAFKKSSLSRSVEDFNSLLKHDIFTTEEQILSIALSGLNCVQYSNYEIYRLWITIKYMDIPSNYKSYVFLHMPSEKEGILDRLFKLFFNTPVSQMNIRRYLKVFSKISFLDQPIFLIRLRCVIKKINYDRCKFYLNLGKK